MASTSTTTPAAHSSVQDILTEEQRVAWYTWGLGGGAVVLVVLGVLSLLYRRGLLINGSARRRRPSHAQPWRHWDWASPRSRLPSLFDLLHVPRRKSTASLTGPEHLAVHTDYTGNNLAPPGPPPFTICTPDGDARGAQQGAGGAQATAPPPPSEPGQAAGRPQRLLAGRQGNPSVVLCVD